MWLSKREEQTRKTPHQALTGPVTLVGGELAAWLEGERRDLAVFSPGGYHWCPQLGDQVLVLKAGEGGEQPCAIGVAQGGALSPGEILIQTGKASVYLAPDGSLQLSTGKGSISMDVKGEIALTGRFTVNGTVVGPPPQSEEGGED